MKIMITNAKKKQKQICSPTLKFDPRAWAKLVFMRDMTDNEVGGFAITGSDDLMLVTDFQLVKQKVTSISVSFEDEAVANFFDDQVQAGRKPEQFARIWLHSHPGQCPRPSRTDEDTFQRVFGNCDWSIMCIVAQDNSTYARLHFAAGPGGEMDIPLCVDYSQEFGACDFKLWQKQYLENVTEDNLLSLKLQSQNCRILEHQSAELFGNDGFDSRPFTSCEDMIEELELMDPSERQAFMDELAARSEFWDEDKEVF